MIQFGEDQATTGLNGLPPLVQERLNLAVHEEIGRLPVW